MAKFIFQIGIRFVLIALFISTVFIGHAQAQVDGASETQDKNLLVQGIHTEQDQQVYASEVTLTKDVYEPGENTSYSFKLYNATPFDVNSLYYKEIVADAVRGDRAYTYVVKGPISLKAGETREVSGSLTMPYSVLKDSLVLRIVPVISSAITYPDAQSKAFIIEGALPALEMGSWAVITNDGKYYPFQAGPSLYENATPSKATVDVWLKPQVQDLNVRYKIQVYKQGVGIGELKYENISEPYLVQSNATSPEDGGLDVSIELPTFSYTPGVYEAYIEFIDDAGKVRAPIIVSRYIVQGDIANIQFARLNVDQIKKGEMVTLITSITGTPIDIFSGRTQNLQSRASLFAEIVNERGDIVAKIEKEIDLKNDFFDETEFVANVSAKSMYIKMKVVKDGKVLSEWNSPLKANYEEVSKKAVQLQYILIISTIAVLLMVIGLYLIKKNRKPSASLVLILFALSAGIGALVPNHVQAAAPSVQITFPSQNQILLPGQKFVPKASIYYKACANRGYNVDAQFIHNNIALAPSQSIASAEESPAHCTGGSRQGQRCTDIGRFSNDCPRAEGGKSRCAFDTHEFIGPNGEEYTSPVEATAPMSPGRYTVRAVVRGTGVTDSDGIQTSEGSDENTYIVQAPPETPDNPATNDDPADNPGPTCSPQDPSCGGTPNQGGTICSPGTSYCSAISRCISDTDTCVNPCEKPRITTDQPLSLTGLCKTGYTPVASSIFGSVNTNSWNWTCQNSAIGVTVQCSESCPTGTYFDQQSNSCTSDIVDWCPNIDGEQRDVSLYSRDASGNCIASGKIKYFRFQPDTTDTMCPAFWETEVSPGAYANCTLDGRSVTDNHPSGSPITQLYRPGSQYTLSCTIRLREDDSLIKTVESRARCFKNVNLQEN